MSVSIFARLKQILIFFIWAIVAFFVVGFFVFVLSILAVLKTGDADEGFALGSIKTKHAVGVVDLSGEILSSDSFRKTLKKAVDEEKIKAVVIRIDSPGGSVGASEEIFRSIKEADQKKPVVCSLANLAASGGLYAAVGCRKIIANAGTITGSIGVVLMMPNVESLVDRFGLQMNVIKSGKFKDTGSPFRKIDADDRQLLQSLVENSYNQFLNTVATARGLEIDKVRGFADGRIILGDDALQKGLVDEIGGVERAAKVALEQTGDTQEPELVAIKKSSGLSSILSGWQESESLQWIESLRHTRLLYQSFF